MALPSPKFYTSTGGEITTHDFGSCEAGAYKPGSTGWTFRLYNDYGGSLSSDPMTSVKISTRDVDGGTDEDWTKQHWIQIKSDGCSSGSTGVMTDDAQTVFTAVGKNKELSIGNIPSNKYRTLFARCYPPTDATEQNVTFQLRVTYQQPATSICSWITGLRDNGVVASTGDPLAMSMGSTGSEIDYKAGYSLIYNNEVYFGSSGTYDISTTGSGTYKIYLSESGSFGETTGSVASNQLQLYEATISSGECTALVDKRVYLAGIQSGTTGAMSSTPDLGDLYLDVTNGKLYAARTAGSWTVIVPGATFIALTDTPANYSGEANKFLSVTSGENAIEFIIPEAAEVGISEVGTATYDDMQDWINNTQSAGKISGGTLSAHIDAITAVTTGGAGSGEFKVAGDQTTGYPATATITVYGSTNNDGDYTVSTGGSSYSTGTTTIPVDEAVAAIADGNIKNGRTDIASGTGFIKITDSEIGVTKSFDWTASYNLLLTNLNTNYIHINYNAGSPVFQATIDRSAIEYNREFTLGQVYRNGTSTWVHSDGIDLPNYLRKSHERLLDVWGYRRASGGDISEYGTRNIQSTIGIFYRGTNKITTAAKASATDKMTTVYYNGSNWVWTEDETAINNTQYNNIASGLVTLSNNTYGIHWVCIDFLGNLYVVFGQDEYTLTKAQNAKVPSSMPVIADNFGIIAAKIIIEKDASSFEEIASAYTQYIPSASPAVHNDLSGLQGGAAGEYYHLTSAQHDEIVSDEQTTGATTGTITIDWGGGRNFSYTRSTNSNGAVTFAFTAPTISSDLRLIIKGSTAGSTGAIVWPAIHWQGGSVASLSSGVSAIDKVNFYYSTGLTSYLGEPSTGYSTV